MATAEGLGEESARKLWRELASAAESGWDFSSRWMAGSTGGSGGGVSGGGVARSGVCGGGGSGDDGDTGGGGGGLRSCRTTHVVPADLNALLYQVRVTLGGLGVLLWVCNSLPLAGLLRVCRWPLPASVAPCCLLAHCKLGRPAVVALDAYHDYRAYSV